MDEEHPETPFCSSRCRLVDLGRWLEGAYRIPDPDPAPGLEPTAPGDEGEDPGSSGAPNDTLIN